MKSVVAPNRLQLAVVANGQINKAATPWKPALQQAPITTVRPPVAQPPEAQTGRQWFSSPDLSSEQQNGDVTRTFPSNCLFQSKESLNTYGQAQRWKSVQDIDLDYVKRSSQKTQKKHDKNIQRKNSKNNGHRVSFSTAIKKNVFDSDTVPDVRNGLSNEQRVSIDIVGD